MGSTSQHPHQTSRPNPVSETTSDPSKRIKTDGLPTASQLALEREAALKELARFRKRKMEYKLP